MNKKITYILILILSVLVASISQIFLKKSANKSYKSFIKEYLNKNVITGYVLLFISTFLTMYSLKVIPLSISPSIESFSYIFVSILSYIYFKEHLSKKQIIGLCLIFIGIIVYSIGYL